MTRIWSKLSVLVGAALLSGCVSGDRGLRSFDDGGPGPDEFSVQPFRPLEIPATTALPPPGGANRADQNPVGDAIAALGGRQISAGGVPATDAALVAAASQNGVAGDIRQVLAAEDAAFRRAAQLRGAFNWLGRDRYFAAYARQALDAYAEFARLRAAGVRVPTAPPEQ